MLKIEWYFSKKILLVSLLTSSVFYTLIFVANLLMNVDKKLDLFDFLLVNILGTFEFFVDFLPVMMFFSFLLAFGSMASSREIVALQALGYTFGRLLTLVLKGSVLMIVIWLLVAELFAPFAINASKQILAAEQQNKSSGRFSKNGEWLRTDDYLIRVISHKNEELFGLTVYQLNDDQKLSSSHEAKTGLWQEKSLLLRDVEIKRYDYEYQSGNAKPTFVSVQTENLPTVDLDLDIDYQIFDSIALEPEQMYLGRLLSYANYIIDNHLDGGSEGKFLFAFWRRVSLPFAVLGLILIMMPTMLGSPRNQNLGDRLFYGVMIGMLYYLGMEVISNLIHHINLPIPMVASGVPMILFVIGLWCSYRSQWPSSK